MAIFKSVDAARDGLDAYSQELIRNRIRYILQAEKIPGGYVDGCNFLMTDVDDIIMQFYLPKRVYHKKNYVQIKHYVLSFSPEYDEVTPRQAYFIGCNIVELFREGGYQVIFAVHEDREYLHIHFLVNPVNLYNGNLLDFGKQGFRGLLIKVQDILDMPHIWCGKQPVKLMRPEDFRDYS